MKSKGFTLVELLAVIVILAIIALIATPIVTKVIDQSEKEAAERSAENYIKAVDIAIAAARLDGKVEDGQYTIKAEENKLCLSDDKCLTVEVNGNKPSGTITIKDEEVVMDSIELTIDDYTVGYSSEKKSFVGIKTEEERDEVENEPTVTKLCTYISQTGTTEKTVGAKYVCNVGSEPKNFYVLELGTDPAENSNLESDEVALILEGNYDTETLPWCAPGSFSGTGSSEDYTCDVRANGLTGKLDEIANVWANLNREEIGLPSAEQIAKATNIEVTETYIDESYSWIYGPDNDECSGYWTSTGGVTDAYVYHVGDDGQLKSDRMDFAFDYVVRPVITISINDLG